MRAIRTSGSEGGGPTIGPPYPYRKERKRDLALELLRLPDKPAGVALLHLPDEPAAS